MTYQPITLEQMRGQLMTLDVAKQRLAPTEGLSEYSFDTTGNSNKIRFDYPDGWAEKVGPDADGLTPTDVVMRLDDTEILLTKDAALDAASKVGLQKSYVLATPGRLISDHMNYWYNNGDKELKLLAGNYGVAFTRATVTPYSNHALIDSAVDAIRQRYGSSAEVLVDYKFAHNLERSDIRLIIADASRSIQSISRSEPDEWSIGINLNNSITGHSSLELSGYGFSWICTNGMISEHISSGKYRRKLTASVEESYEWTSESVDAILEGMEMELERISHLTEISLEDELVDTLDSMFKEFGVPASLRERVVDNLAESDDLSAYGLLNAVTAVGNDPDLSAKHVEHLLRSAGRIPDSLIHRCPTCHKV